MMSKFELLLKKQKSTKRGHPKKQTPIHSSSASSSTSSTTNESNFSPKAKIIKKSSKMELQSEPKRKSKFSLQ